MNDEMTNGVAENNATVVDEKGFVVVDAPTTVSEEEKAPKDKTSVMHWIVEGVLLVAVIVLYTALLLRECREKDGCGGKTCREGHWRGGVHQYRHNQ